MSQNSEAKILLYKGFSMGNQEVLKLSFEIISRKLKWDFFKNLGTISGTLLSRMSKNTAWKVSKYGVFPGPNTENTDQKKLRIWTLFT